MECLNCGSDEFEKVYDRDGGIFYELACVNCGTIKDLDEEEYNLKEEQAHEDPTSFY